MTSRHATVLGIAAILVWSTNAAATITLLHHLGPCTLLAVVSALAGAVLAVLEDLRHRRFGAFLRIGWSFGLAGGTCFLVNQILFVVAFALADPATSLPLNLVNYAWPSLTVLLCIATRRAQFDLRHLPLLAGVLIGIAGIAVATSSDLSPGALVQAVGRCPFGFLAMAGAAVSWAAFSALAVPLHRAGAPSGTALFFLLTAAVAAIARLVLGETATLAAGDAPLLAYTVLAPAAGGYLMWELAMRRGDVPLLGALSNALPLLSTGVLWLTLRARGGGHLGLGAVLVCLGAVQVHRGARRRIPA